MIASRYFRGRSGYGSVELSIAVPNEHVACLGATEGTRALLGLVFVDEELTRLASITLSIAAERFCRGRPALWVQFPCTAKGAGASAGFDSRAVFLLSLIHI